MSKKFLFLLLGGGLATLIVVSLTVVVTKNYYENKQIVTEDQALKDFKKYLAKERQKDIDLFNFGRKKTSKSTHTIQDFLCTGKAGGKIKDRLKKKFPNNHNLRGNPKFISDYYYYIIEGEKIKKQCEIFEKTGNIKYSCPFDDENIEKDLSNIINLTLNAPPEIQNANRSELINKFEDQYWSIRDYCISVGAIEK